MIEDDEAKGDRPGPDAAERRMVRRLRRGSPRAAEQLVREHWHAARDAAALIVRDVQLAEDIAQESLLQAIRSIDRFDGSRRLRPWIHRIVVNRCFDQLRSPAARNPTTPIPKRTAATEERDVGVSDPEIASALWALDLEERTAVVLRHVFGYRAVEIAELMDVPDGTVRSRLHRGLAHLRAELGDDPDLKEADVVGFD